MLLLLAALAMVLAVQARLADGSAFDGDEGHHAMYGAQVYLDLAHGDLGAFLRDSYAQNRWPFLYSWFQVPLLAVLGITPLAHRLTAALWYLVLVAAVFWCARETTRAPGAGWRGGSLAALLILGAPRLPDVATLVYFETCSLALLALTWAAYLRALRGGAARWAWAAGGLHLASWLVKWQFGILMSAVLVLHLLLLHQGRLRALWRDPLARRLLLTAWVPVALWLANPYQLREFLLYLSGVPAAGGLGEMLTSGLRLQWHNLTHDYTASPGAVVLLLLGLGWGLWKRREPGALLLVLTVALAVLTGLKMRGGAESRIGLWILPPLAVLAGAGVEDLLAYLVRRQGRVLAGALGALLLVVAAGQAALGVDLGLQRLHEGYRPYLWGVVEQITAQVPPTDRTVLLGGWDRGLNPNLVRWAYLQRYGAKVQRLEDLRVWDYPPPDPDERDVLHFRWPWRVRVSGPPGPELPPAALLARAGADTLLVPYEPGEVSDPGREELLRTAEQKLRFSLVRTLPAPGGYRCLIYWRSAATRPR